MRKIPRTSSCVKRTKIKNIFTRLKPEIRLHTRLKLEPMFKIFPGRRFKRQGNDFICLEVKLSGGGDNVKKLENIFKDKGIIADDKKQKKWLFKWPKDQPIPKLVHNATIKKSAKKKRKTYMLYELPKEVYHTDHQLALFSDY